MSLFGDGGVHPSVEESEADSNSPPSSRSEEFVPSSTKSEADEKPHFHDSDIEEDSQEHGDEAEEEEEEQGPNSHDSHVDFDGERPNKWRGPARTWMGHTSTERSIAASLDRTRDADLSIHLYNAFALKRRLRSADPALHAANLKPWHSKERWIAAEGSARSRPWQPPKSWTAWPLPPEELPLREDEVSAARGNGSYRREEFRTPRDDLKDAIVAVVLWWAKDRYRARTGEGGVSPCEDGGGRGSQGASQEADLERGIDSGSDYAGSVDSVPSTKSPVPEGMLESEQASPVTDAQEHEEEGGGDENDRSRESSASLSDSGSSATVLADDERAHKLLEPSVNSLIARIDSLLVALHVSRQHGSKHDERRRSGSTPDRRNHRSVSTDRNRSKIRTSTGSPAPSRPRGRPRKVVVSSEAGQRQDSEAQASAEPGESSKRRRGRPSQYGKPRPGESYYLMRKRLAESRENSPSSLSPAHSTSAISEAEEHAWQDSEEESSSSEAEHGRRQGRRITENLRDWSNVLGLAALTGWDPRVVNRAAKRCELLFGETMSFRTFDEREALGSSPNVNELGDADSYDEMFGGVHVDGYMTPVESFDDWSDGDVSQSSAQGPSKRRRHE